MPIRTYGLYDDSCNSVSTKLPRIDIRGNFVLTELQKFSQHSANLVDCLSPAHPLLKMPTSTNDANNISTVRAS